MRLREDLVVPPFKTGQKKRVPPVPSRVHATVASILGSGEPAYTGRMGRKNLVVMPLSLN